MESLDGYSKESKQLLVKKNKIIKWLFVIKPCVKRRARLSS